MVWGQSYIRDGLRRRYVLKPRLCIYPRSSCSIMQVSSMVDTASEFEFDDSTKLAMHSWLGQCFESMLLFLVNVRKFYHPWWAWLPISRILTLLETSFDERLPTRHSLHRPMLLTTSYEVEYLFKVKNSDEFDSGCSDTHTSVHLNLCT